MVNISLQALSVTGTDSLWCLSPNWLLTTVGVLLPAKDCNDSGDTEVHIPTYQNSTGAEHYPFDNLMQNLINSCILLISPLGLVGNGVVIWLLGFRIKRNPYTTYILNLSVAGFGVLICLICGVLLVFIHTLNRINYVFSWFHGIFFYLFFFTYSTSQFLLVAISIERCVAAFFPLWHRCHRPPHLSAIACALVNRLYFTKYFQRLLKCEHNQGPLPPFFIPSFYSKANQLQRGKLITAIPLALLFFLIFAFPLNLIYIILYLFYIHFSVVTLLSLILFGLLCASLNSSINPLIYFLVGKRQRQRQARVSMKVALQRVFEDEQDCKREQNTQIETLE
ncbi:LOW QUALITY PROTEIN: proto-oncogene Mas-like [Pogona vitticeps]